MRSIAHIVFGLSALFALSLALAACGDDGEGDLREQQLAQAAAEESSGPKLGDGCRAATAINSTVEVATVKGPLECGEAQSILGAYYSNLENAEGSGGGLEVERWFCISFPPPEAPLVGECTEKDGRRFELYSIADAPGEERDQLEAELESQLRAEGVLQSKNGPCVRDELFRLNDTDLERAVDPASDVIGFEAGAEAQLVCAGVPTEPTRCIIKELHPYVAQREPLLSRVDYRELVDITGAVRDTCLGIEPEFSGE